MKHAVKTVEISGAGPAGIAAALAVSANGHHALVYERKADVGKRFHGDFQGLENWTTEEDVLEELQSLGIQINFKHKAVNEVVCFDPNGTERVFTSHQPFFYLLQRGDGIDTLDHSLKLQAIEAGVEIRFNTRLSKLPSGGIVTEGPHRADVIATGYLFDTDMADGIYAAISDELAPKGYAYLLINEGQGTLSTCMFNDFHNDRMYLERCVDFFARSVDLRMKNPRRFGGVGNAALSKTVRKQNILYAGEAAGFQDPLFGFGMRWAMISGAAAGQAMANSNLQQYEQVVKKRLVPHYQSAATSRWFYEKLGNRGYGKTLKNVPKNNDVRNWLHQLYAPRWWKRVWYSLIASRPEKLLLNLSDNCDCTWCRCKREKVKS